MIAEAIMDIWFGYEHTRMKNLQARKMYNILIGKYAKFIKRKNWHTGEIVFYMESGCSAQAFFLAADMGVETVVLCNYVQIIG